MSDFLTRLIQRNLDLAPQGGRAQEVEPLIAPLYAGRPYASPPYAATSDVFDEEVISVAEQRQASAPRVSEAAPANTAIAALSQRHESRERVSPEIKTAPASADDTQSGRLNQPSGSEALFSPPPSTGPGAAATEGGRFQHADAEPVIVHPRTVARADESNSRAGIATNRAASEATGETAAPVIRVTIGRVEVRAIMQSAPPARRQSPAAARLSLEDYLRSRSGRK
jgi:hypothetical protein